MRYLLSLACVFFALNVTSTLAHSVNCIDVTKSSSLGDRLLCTSTIAIRGTLGTFLLPVADNFAVSGKVIFGEPGKPSSLNLNPSDFVDVGKPCKTGSGKDERDEREFDNFTIEHFLRSTQEADPADRRNICLGRDQDGDITFYMELDSDSIRRVDAALDQYPHIQKAWKNIKGGLMHVELVMFGRNVLKPTRQLFNGWKNEGVLLNGEPMTYNGFLNRTQSCSECNAAMKWKCPCMAPDIGKAPKMLRDGSRVRVTGALVVDCDDHGTPACRKPGGIEIHPAYELWID